MKVNLYKKDQIQICSNNVCVKANGYYANVITAAVVITILMIGVATLAKVTN